MESHASITNVLRFIESISDRIKDELEDNYRTELQTMLSRLNELSTQAISTNTSTVPMNELSQTSSRSTRRGKAPPLKTDNKENTLNDNWAVPATRATRSAAAKGNQSIALGTSMDFTLSPKKPTRGRGRKAAPTTEPTAAWINSTMNESSATFFPCPDPNLSSISNITAANMTNASFMPNLSSIGDPLNLSAMPPVEGVRTRRRAAALNRSQELLLTNMLDSSIASPAPFLVPEDTQTVGTKNIAPEPVPAPTQTLAAKSRGGRAVRGRKKAEPLGTSTTELTDSHVVSIPVVKPAESDCTMQVPAQVQPSPEIIAAIMVSEEFKQQDTPLSTQSHPSDDRPCQTEPVQTVETHDEPAASAIIAPVSEASQEEEQLEQSKETSANRARGKPRARGKGRRRAPTSRRRKAPPKSKTTNLTANLPDHDENDSEKDPEGQSLPNGMDESGTDKPVTTTGGGDTIDSLEQNSSAESSSCGHKEANIEPCINSNPESRDEIIIQRMMPDGIKSSNTPHKQDVAQESAKGESASIPSPQRTSSSMNSIEQNADVEKETGNRSTFSTPEIARKAEVINHFTPHAGIQALTSHGFKPESLVSDGRLSHGLTHDWIDKTGFRESRKRPIFETSSLTEPDKRIHYSSSEYTRGETTKDGMSDEDTYSPTAFVSQEEKVEEMNPDRNGISSVDAFDVMKEAANTFSIEIDTNTTPQIENEVNVSIETKEDKSSEIGTQDKTTESISSPTENTSAVHSSSETYTEPARIYSSDSDTKDSSTHHEVVSEREISKDSCPDNSMDTEESSGSKTNSPRASDNHTIVPKNYIDESTSSHDSSINKIIVQKPGNTSLVLNPVNSSLLNESTSLSDTLPMTKDSNQMSISFVDQKTGNRLFRPRRDAAALSETEAELARLTEQWQQKKMNAPNETVVPSSGDKYEKLMNTIGRKDTNKSDQDTQLRDARDRAKSETEERKKNLEGMIKSISGRRAVVKANVVPNENESENTPSKSDGSENIPNPDIILPPKPSNIGAPPRMPVYIPKRETSNIVAETKIQAPQTRSVAQTIDDMTTHEHQQPSNPSEIAQNTSTTQLNPVSIITKFSATNKTMDDSITRSIPPNRSEQTGTSLNTSASAFSNGPQIVYSKGTSIPTHVTSSLPVEKQQDLTKSEARPFVQTNPSDLVNDDQIPNPQPVTKPISSKVPPYSCAPLSTNVVSFAIPNIDPNYQYPIAGYDEEPDRFRHRIPKWASSPEIIRSISVENRDADEIFKKEYLPSSVDLEEIFGAPGSAIKKYLFTRR